MGETHGPRNHLSRKPFFEKATLIGKLKYFTSCWICFKSINICRFPNEDSSLPLAILINFSQCSSACRILQPRSRRKRRNQWEHLLYVQRWFRQICFGKKYISIRNEYIYLSAKIARVQQRRISSQNSVRPCGCWRLLPLASDPARSRPRCLLDCGGEQRSNGADDGRGQGCGTRSEMGKGTKWKNEMEKWNGKMDIYRCGAEHTVREQSGPISRRTTAAGWCPQDPWPHSLPDHRCRGCGRDADHGP